MVIRERGIIREVQQLEVSNQRGELTETDVVIERGVSHNQTNQYLITFIKDNIFNPVATHTWMFKPIQTIKKHVQPNVIYIEVLVENILSLP